MPNETASDTFRAQVLERWSLTDPELVLLDQAAATLDLIGELEGSEMPLRERARELRAQRLTFARLLSQLALPDGKGGKVASITHQRAKKAAEVRWASHG
jgi:hypothetical protein